MNKGKWILSVLLLMILFFFFGVFYFVYPIKYKNVIEKYSQTYNVDKVLIASVICVESRFNKNAISVSGACGLMQIMPTTADWISEQLNIVDYNLFDPDNNIMFGTYYLHYLFDKYQNEIFVLACYNAGESVVCGWGNKEKFSIDNIKYNETKKYVLQIQKLKKIYISRF